MFGGENLASCLAEWKTPPTVVPRPRGKPELGILVNCILYFFFRSEANHKILP